MDSVFLHLSLLYSGVLQMGKRKHKAGRCLARNPSGLTGEQGGQRRVSCQLAACQTLCQHLVRMGMPIKLGVTRSNSSGLRRINLSLLTSLLGSSLLRSGNDLSNYSHLLRRQDLPQQCYASDHNLVGQIHTEKGTREGAAPPCERRKPAAF